jgi:hypothetical protein
MHFYISINNQKSGPFSLNDLSKQKINPDTLVWSAGMDNWLPAKDVPELQELIKANNLTGEGYTISDTIKNEDISTVTEPSSLPSINHPIKQEATNNDINLIHQINKPKKRTKLFIIVGVLLLLGLAYFWYASRPPKIIVDTTTTNERPKIIGPKRVIDLSKYNKLKLDTIRNTIYAHNGYVFKNKGWSNYFKKQNWYKPDSAHFSKIQITSSTQDTLNSIKLFLKNVK